MAYKYPPVSVEQASAQLGASVQAVRRYCRSGILRCERDGRGYQIDQVAVLALMKVIRQAKVGKTKPPKPRSGNLLKSREAATLCEASGSAQEPADQGEPAREAPRASKGPCPPFGWLDALFEMPD